MISQNLIEAISRCAREFDAGAVWLFGSSLGNESVARDIDLAVEGIASEKFFPFYAKLILEMPKPVDLVDLSLNPPIRHIVRAEGVRIYER